MHGIVEASLLASGPHPGFPPSWNAKDKSKFFLEFINNKPEWVQPKKSRSEKFKNGYFLGLTNMRYILALVSVVYKEIATKIHCKQNNHLHSKLMKCRFSIFKYF